MIPAHYPEARNYAGPSALRGRVIDRGPRRPARRAAAQWLVNNGLRQRHSEPASEIENYRGFLLARDFSRGRCEQRED